MSRIDFPTAGREIHRALAALERSIDLDRRLADLIKLRVSQINGCAFCLDMHFRDLRELGEEDRRLATVSAWRETSLFDDRERAALAFAEAVTLLADGGVPDAVYDEAARHFSDAELANLLGAVIAINAWNRMAVSTGTQPPT